VGKQTRPGGLFLSGRQAVARGLTCPPGRRSATHYRLAATQEQRGLRGDHEQAL